MGVDDVTPQIVQALFRQRARFVKTKDPHFATQSNPLGIQGKDPEFLQPLLGGVHLADGQQRTLTMPETMMMQ